MKNESITKSKRSRKKFKINNIYISTDEDRIDLSLLIMNIFAYFRGIINVLFEQICWLIRFIYVKLSTFFKCILAHRKINLKNINYQKLNSLEIKPYTLVLDLDETLVHTSTRKLSGSIECKVKFKTGSEIRYWVKFRPFLNEFLQELDKYYNIIIFTASLSEYADAVLGLIDSHPVI